MPERSIPPQEWRELFDRFSRRHQGRLASLAVSGASGAQDSELTHDKPLASISVEMQGAQSGAVRIVLAQQGRDQVAHTIAGAARVRLEQTDQGADQTLCIEHNEGGTTCIRFRSRRPGEMVDGLPA